MTVGKANIVTRQTRRLKRFSADDDDDGDEKRKIRKEEKRENHSCVYKLFCPLKTSSLRHWTFKFRIFMGFAMMMPFLRLTIVARSEQ